MNKKDPKEEQKQLDAISASIKDKRNELEGFNEHIKVAQKELDDDRLELKKMREQILEDDKVLLIKRDTLDADIKKQIDQLEEINMKRVALDRLAKASDDRLALAKGIEEQNKKTLEEIEKRNVTVDTGNETLKKELQDRLAGIDAIEQQKADEYKKTVVQHEALKAERAEIQENKSKYKKLVTEIVDTKGELASQLNKNKDLEQSLQKLQLELKGREQNCESREKILSDNEIELEAKWAKLNRKIEIMGFTKELEVAKKEA